MPIGSIVGSLASAGIGYLGARSAAKAQERAANAAIATQREFFNITRGDLSPYRKIGGGAIRSLGQLYGIGANGKATGQPFPQESLDAFNRSPDYQYALQEGLKSVEQSRAARGALHSGGTLEELQAKGSGLASQNFGNYVSRLLQLAGIGENAAAASGSAAASTGANISGLQQGIGEARASGIVGGANALTGAIGDITNNLSIYKLTNPSKSSFAGAGSQGGLW